MTTQKEIRDATELVDATIYQALEEKKGVHLSARLPLESMPGSSIKTTVYVEYVEFAGQKNGRLEAIEYDPEPHLEITDGGDYAWEIDEEVLSDYAELVGLSWYEAIESMGYRLVSVDFGTATYHPSGEWVPGKMKRLDARPYWFVNDQFEIDPGQAKRCEEEMRQLLKKSEA